MNRHPGGAEHTRRMLSLAVLPAGSRILDLGAGAGEAVELMAECGYRAEGIDREPRSELVRRGDLLHTDYPDGTFDAVLSQCAFFVSGDVRGALRESARILCPKGMLLLSDVFFEDPEALLREAGFTILKAENMTPQWREYYLEALWHDDCDCGPLPKGKSEYWMLIGKKEEKDGSD